MLDLNGREQAILIWIAVLALIFLFKREIRTAFAGVVKAFLHPKILKWVFGLLALTVATAFALHSARLGKESLWEVANLKTTLVWVLTFAVVTMIDVNRVADEKGSFKKLARGAIAPTAWVVFLGTLNTFSVWIELALVPFVVFLGLLLVVAERDEKSAILVKPLQYLAALTALVMMGYSLYEIATDFGDFARAHTLREFVVPIVLTLAFVPFLFVMTVFMAYENAFVSLKIRRPDDKAVHRYALVRSILAFGGNKELLRRFQRDLVLHGEYDRQAVRDIIRRIKRLRKRELHPPAVPPETGWSPYVAGRFLEAEGLATRDYHDSIGDWFGESPTVKFGTGMFTDSLTYSIAGTEMAATRLKLRLNANVPGEPEASELKFWETARSLLGKVLDAGEVERAIAALKGPKGRYPSVSGLTVTVGRDDWGDKRFGGYERRLTIRHPAECSS